MTQPLRPENSTFDDTSRWEIDRLGRLGALLWLQTDDVTVAKSKAGSPDYDYLLTNTTEHQKAHAKFTGVQPR